MKEPKKIQKAIKEKVRKDFIEQGGHDGRFAPKVVPNKKKKVIPKKKVDPDKEIEL